jgi:hypothetical protein
MSCIDHRSGNASLGQNFSRTGVTSRVGAAAPGGTPVAPGGAVTRSAQLKVPWVVSPGDAAIFGEAGRRADNAEASPSGTETLGPTANDAGRAELIPGRPRSRPAEVDVRAGFGGIDAVCSGIRTSTFASDGSLDTGPDFHHDPQGQQGQALTLRQDSSPANHAARITAVAVGPHNIQYAMANAGYGAADCCPIIRTYSAPIPGGNGFRFHESGLKSAVHGCAIWKADTDRLDNTVVPIADDTLRRAAPRARQPHTSALDDRQAQAGHRLCENADTLLEEPGPSSRRTPGTADRSEWVQQVRTLTTVVGPHQTPRRPTPRPLGATRPTQLPATNRPQRRPRRHLHPHRRNHLRRTPDGPELTGQPAPRPVPSHATARAAVGNLGAPPGPAPAAQPTWPPCPPARRHRPGAAKSRPIATTVMPVMPPCTWRACATTRGSSALKLGTTTHAASRSRSVHPGRRRGTAATTDPTPMAPVPRPPTPSGRPCTR